MALRLIEIFHIEQKSGKVFARFVKAIGSYNNYLTLIRYPIS